MGLLQIMYMIFYVLMICLKKKDGLLTVHDLYVLTICIKEKDGLLTEATIYGLLQLQKMIFLS